MVGMRRNDNAGRESRASMIVRTDVNVEVKGEARAE